MIKIEQKSNGYICWSNAADMNNPQLMEATLNTETGLIAQKNVDMELKPEQELALTLLLPMVVLIVLGRLLKLKHAFLACVQV